MPRELQRNVLTWQRAGVPKTLENNSRRPSRPDRGFAISSLQPRPPRSIYVPGATSTLPHLEEARLPHVDGDTLPAVDGSAFLDALGRLQLLLNRLIERRRNWFKLS